jgi:flagellar basal-body rod protein FlgB
MIRPISQFAEHMLDLTAKRQQALSANVANADTPGYRATDFSFQEELSAVQLEATHESHIKLADDSGVRHYEVHSKVKENGNDVDLERELTELSKNAMKYMTLIQFLNQKIRTLRSSINEGGRT